jgi:hypothetical protein
MSGQRGDRKSMRMSLRLILSLVLDVTLLTFLFAMFQMKTQKRGLRKELANRAVIVGESERQVEQSSMDEVRKRA